MVFVFFALYLLLRVRRSEARDVVLLNLSFITAWAIGEFLMRIAPDENLAFIGSRVFLNIGIGLLGPTTLYMVLLITEYVKPLKGISLFIYIYLLPLWIIVIRAGTNWIQTGVTLFSWGYTDETEGPLSVPYYIYIVSFFFVALAILGRHYMRSEGRIKQISLLLFIGTVIPLALTILTDVVLTSINIDVPGVSVPSCIIYVIAFIIALNKYEIFEIKPVSEKQSITAGKGKSKEEAVFKDLPGGKMYYISESKPDTSVKVFSSLVSHGRQGLGIVRISPQKFRELTGLEKTPVVWLSSQEGQSVTTINPSAISRIYVTVAEFLKSAERPVILLEGIEALIFTNNFREIMGFISSVYEKVSVSEGVIIVPISRPTLNEAEWSLLTRHMDDLAAFISAPADA